MCDSGLGRALLGAGVGRLRRPVVGELHEVTMVAQRGRRNISRNTTKYFVGHETHGVLEKKKKEKEEEGESKQATGTLVGREGRLAQVTAA